jgi:hypothetical protein
MFRRALARLYSSLPFARELARIRDTLAALHANLKSIPLIRTIDFELPNHPRYSDPKRLFLPHCQVCSQNGEDGMIREIFRRIGTTNRVFVEIGVDSAENNTAFLLSQGWTGLWVDGHPRVHDLAKGRADLQGGCLKTHAGFVTRENAAGILQKYELPEEFDVLSLDIDQNTFHLWEALGSFRPRAVVVEYNASLPADLDWKVRYSPERVWDGSVNFGASLKAFELLGGTLGYSLVGCDFFGINAFFVRNDLLGDHFCAPFTAENHFEPPRYSATHRRGHPPAILDRW